MQWSILFLTVLILPPVLMMQETYKKVILKKRARRHLERQKYEESTAIGSALLIFFKANFVRPLHMLFTELVVAAFSIYMAFVLMLGTWNTVRGCRGHTAI